MSCFARLARLARLGRQRSDRADRSDRGVSAIEYALLAGAVSLAVVAGLSSLQGEFDTAYDDRQPQYGAPHATGQTTTTAAAASSSSSSSSSTSSTSSSSTTSSTLASTTTTTAPPVNMSYWWHTPYWTTGVRWSIDTGMYVLHTDGTPYAFTAITVSYFDINQFPIGTRSGTTDGQGFLQLTSPSFKKTDHARVFLAVTSVGGSSNWEGTLTNWVNKPG